MPKIKLTILLLILVPFVTVAQSDMLAANNAIDLAERFIRINGYTTEPADTIQMQPEFIYDDELSKTKIEKNRLNTLQPKATYISEHKKEFYVGFLYTTEVLNEHRKKYKDFKSKGRAVIIAKDMSEIRMAHKTPQFEKWKRINQH